MKQTPEQKAIALFTAAGYTNDVWAMNMAQDAAMLLRDIAHKMQVIRDVHYAATRQRPMEVQHGLPHIVPALIAEIKEMLEANDYTNAAQFWDDVEMEVTGLEITE